MDHFEQLGPTLEDITWHKAGIFKNSAPAFSVVQECGTMQIMRNCAAEKNTEITFVPITCSLPVNNKVLSVPVQRLNCSLAFELARSFVYSKKPDHVINYDDILSGIESFSWTGRSEVISDGTTRWFLDGAHNTLSLAQATEWFSNFTDAQKYIISCWY